MRTTTCKMCGREYVPVASAKFCGSSLNRDGCYFKHKQNLLLKKKQKEDIAKQLRADNGKNSKKNNSAKYYFSKGPEKQEQPDMSLTEAESTEYVLKVLEQIVHSIYQLEDLEQVLGSKYFNIISARYGLMGPRGTLQSIADDMGLTRERVRQIESRGIEKIRILYDRGDFSRNIYQELFRFARNKTLLSHISLQTKFNPQSVVELYLCIFPEIFALTSIQDLSVQYLVLQEDVATFTEKIRALIQYLRSQSEYILISELQSQFALDDSVFTNLKDIVIRDDKIAHRKNKNIFSGQNIQLVENILAEAKRPMHVDEISIKANLRKGQVTGSIDRSERIVNIGPSIYALTDWGYLKGHIADVVEHFMRLENQPMQVQKIINLVRKQRLYGDGSVVAALSTDLRFQRTSFDYYALRVWGYKEEYQVQSRQYGIRTDDAIMDVIKQSGELLSLREIGDLIDEKFGSQASTLGSTLSAALTRLVEHNRIYKVLDGRNVRYSEKNV